MGLREYGVVVFEVRGDIIRGMLSLLIRLYVYRLPCCYAMGLTLLFSSAE